MSDALDRLKKRNRPKVARRDASLSIGDGDIQTQRHADVEMSLEPEGGTLGSPQELRSSQSPDISESRHIDIGMPESTSAELLTKRSTFRLEVGLIDRLHSFCRRQGLSREVLIEAMFEYMEQHPEDLEQVVAEARIKHEHRQQLANRKRAESMMQKFGG